MKTKNISDRYNADYFNWQKNSAVFGGIANSFKFKKNVKPEYTVIDFGCGGGFLLKNLNCKKKFGIEINTSAHSVIIDNDIIPYSTSSHLLEEKGKEFADLIISNHSLEHCINPLSEIKLLYQLLKKNGKIHLIVPCDTIKYEWKPNDINFHLFSWSPMNLGNLFVAAGFKVLKTNPIIHKWPPFYKNIQKIFGWQVFNLICSLWGRIKNQSYQVEIIATK